VLFGIGQNQRDNTTGRQYTGQINDGATGLYYYNARYYDPALHKFIQADTIVPDPNDPQTLNRFSYVNNNPVKYIDPTGHDADCSTNDSSCTEQWTLEQWEAEGIIFDLGAWINRFDGPAKLQIIVDSLNAIPARYGADQTRNFLYDKHTKSQHLVIEIHGQLGVNGYVMGQDSLMPHLLEIQWYTNLVTSLTIAQGLVRISREIVVLMGMPVDIGRIFQSGVLQRQGLGNIVVMVLARQVPIHGQSRMKMEH
jgi:RHS repeat-associated protein